MVAASRAMPELPTARPATATPIGSPAPTAEPRAMTRISRAIPTPTSSPRPLMGSPAVSGTSPPSSTCRPESTVPAIAPSSGSMLAIRSGCVMGSAYCTVRTAVSPSSLSRAGADVGDVLEAAQALGQACRSRRTGSGSPSRSWTTTRALAKPPTPCSRSRSMPCWARAPGTSQSSRIGRAERRGERRGGGHEQDPGTDHPPRMGGGRAAETVEVRRHGGLLGCGSG